MQDILKVFRNKITFTLQCTQMQAFSGMIFLAGTNQGISLTPHYHFRPPHKFFDISRVIIAENLPLHIAGDRIRTGNPWFPSTNC